VYVCICNNVTEGDIKKAVQNGARTLDCLVSRLAVSTCCGQCQYYAHACLQSALEAAIPLAVSTDPAAQLTT
jgi:bacterioferritin-associated ferredoxin